MCPTARRRASSRARSSAAATWRSPTRCRRDLDPRLRHRAVEAVVGHHGDRDPAAELPGSRRWRAASASSSSPSCTRPSPSTAMHAVAVAVEGEAELAVARSATRSARASGWVEPQPSLMLRPSGSVADRLDLAPRRSKIGRRGPVGRAVRAVEHEPQAREVEPERRGQLAHVVVQGALERPDVARLAAPSGGDGRDRSSIRASASSLELAAVGAEELDAVVLPGVVRGRDDGGEVEAVAADQDRGRRRGQDAARARRRRRPAAIPAASADSSIGPDSRVSRTIRTWGRSASPRRPRRGPSASASSAVTSSPATPRTPSVPKSVFGGRP